MKMYRLKKDLSRTNTKAGALFGSSENGDLYCFYGGRNIEIGSDIFNLFPGLLEEWFEEIPDEPKTVWGLKEGDRYWFIRTNNWVDDCMWNDSQYDIGCRVGGNCFLTKEEAEKELAYRKAKAILERDTKGFKPDWKDGGNSKYDVYYDHINKHLVVGDHSIICTHKDLWFATYEDAEASIKAHEKEWKTYLGVEE